MKLYHVVAVANNNVMGKNNQLPWPKLSADLKFFKDLTTDQGKGGVILMGRKTFQSIGRALPNRINYVLSRSLVEPAEFKIIKRSEEKVYFFQSLQDALDKYLPNADKIYIIGGAEIFKQTMDKIDGIYLTRIYADYKGDTYYPLDLETSDLFKEKSRTLLQENPKIEVLYYEKQS